MWWALASLIASIIINVALQPKPAVPQPATLKDMNIPQVKEGTPQSVVFGEVWTSDWQVLGFGDFRTRPVRAKQAKK